MKSNPQSFLIINPFGIGDVLFSTPLLRNIREQRPDARIYYLCNKRVATILANHPLIRKTFIYERDEFEQDGPWSLKRFKRYWRFIREIREEAIEVAIDLSLNTKFGWMAWLAGIPVRAGLNYRNRGKFLNRKVTLAGYDDKHVARYYLSVLPSIGLQGELRKMEVYSDEASQKWITAFCKENNIKDKEQVVGIAPCGGEAFGPNAFMKRWPASYYAELINRLEEHSRVKFFLFAGKNEKQTVNEILAAVRNPERCYEFTDASLPQLVALVERCGLFIGNDTGPLRFADALEKKIIAFFGPVDERVYGTFPFDATRHVVLNRDLPCRPCYRRFRLPPCPYDIRCLKDIDVDEAALAAERLLSGGRKIFL